MKDNDFYEKVWELVRKIPYGRVCSYGAIAEHLGSKGSARMVGYAMNAAHKSPLDVPAHRVVNRNGILSGKHHFGAPGLMQELLESEGLEIFDDKILHFKELFWKPE